MKNNIIVIALILLPFFVFVWIDQADVLKWWIAIVAMCIVYINFDKFQSFTLSAGKIEAKLKEAEQIIEEAQATLHDLKETTEPLITFSLAQMTETLLVKSRDKQRLLETSIKYVEEFNITDERTLELLESSLRNIYNQYLMDIMSSSSQYDPGGITEDDLKLSKFFCDLMDDETIVEPSVISRFYKENPHRSNSQVVELIESFEAYFRKHLYKRAN